jgi:hypothetical protein
VGKDEHGWKGAEGLATNEVNGDDYGYLSSSARLARWWPARLDFAVSPVLVTGRVAGIWYVGVVVDALVLRCIRVKRPDLLSGPSFFAPSIPKTGGEIEQPRNQATKPDRITECGTGGLNRISDVSG